MFGFPIIILIMRGTGFDVWVLNHSIIKGTEFHKYWWILHHLIMRGTGIDDWVLRHLIMSSLRYYAYE